MKYNLKKWLFTALSIFLIINISLAQNNEDRIEKIKEEFTHLINTRQWQEAEKKVNQFYKEYPANPTELDKIEKYEVDKFYRTIKESLYDEDRTYRAIQESKSIALCQEYLKKYPSGKYRNEVQSILSNQKDENAWEKAKSKRSSSAYYEYLDNFPNGNHATTALETIKKWDKEAYEKAISEGTQEALNNYIKNYPRGEYKNKIKDKLAERKEYDMYMYAKTHNNIGDYEVYIKEYPNGKYATEVNRIIENSYYNFGNEAYTHKKYSNAKSYYETYISKFPHGTYSSEVRSKIKMCQRKLNQRSASFLMYTYDSESPIGISIGRLNKNGVGHYLNLKLNPEIFTGFNVLYKVDDAGNHDRPGDIIRTGDVKYGNVSLSGGITLKIVYPLWAYIGGGVGYFPVYEHADTYYSYGDFWEEDWLRNTDQTKIGLFPEGGLKLKVVNVLVLKYGIMYHGGIFHQFGLGFQL